MHDFLHGRNIDKFYHWRKTRHPAGIWNFSRYRFAGPRNNDAGSERRVAEATITLTADRSLPTGFRASPTFGLVGSPTLISTATLWLHAIPFQA
jgi:hypothetical protein